MTWRAIAIIAVPRLTNRTKEGTTMVYYAIIFHHWVTEPGKVRLGPFGTRQDAQAAIDWELYAACEILVGGRKGFSGEIVSVDLPAS